LLSIIVPARNDAVTTRECLVSAVNSLGSLNLNCEFVLIDDASDPAEGIPQVFQDICAAAPQHAFKIARTKTRVHYTGVFSLGLHLATKEKVFFLSNDMLITPQFLTAVLGVAALSRDFGIVRGTSNYCDSHPEHAVTPPDILRRYDDVANFSQAMLAIKGLAFTEDSVLSGDAVLISRALIERIGVLDQRFYGYFGDVDYGLRAHLAGFKMVCAKGAWLWHKGAGHVKADAAKTKQDFGVHHSERMKLVDAAYQVFRQKWDAGLPAAYSELGSLHLFAMAEKNKGRIEVKYDYPAGNGIAFDLV
jgi:GT2 family glycosyltransferase